MIVRRVVEARRQHRQQQFPQEPNQPNQPNGQLHRSPQRSSQQQLFPAGLLHSSQAISHAMTPPLTTEERKLSHSHAHRDHDNSSAENSPLRGIGRALSRRVPGLKRSKSMALKRDHRHEGEAATTTTATATGDSDANAQAPGRSKSVCQQKNDGHSVSRPGFKKENGKTGHEPDRVSPWWRRILC